MDWGVVAGLAFVYLVVGYLLASIPRLIYSRMYAYEYFSSVWGAPADLALTLAAGVVSIAIIGVLSSGVSSTLLLNLTVNATTNVTGVVSMPLSVPEQLAYLAYMAPVVLTLGVVAKLVVAATARLLAYMSG